MARTWPTWLAAYQFVCLQIFIYEYPCRPGRSRLTPLWVRNAEMLKCRVILTHTFCLRPRVLRPAGASFVGVAAPPTPRITFFFSAFRRRFHEPLLNFIFIADWFFQIKFSILQRRPLSVHLQDIRGGDLGFRRWQRNPLPTFVRRLPKIRAFSFN